MEERGDGLTPSGSAGTGTSGEAGAGEAAGQEAARRVEQAIAAARQARQAGRYDEAARLLLDALEHRVRADSIFFHLGNVYFDAGDLVRAEYAYRRAIQLNPSHANAHHNLAVVYKKTGRIAESVVAQKQAVRLALAGDWGGGGPAGGTRSYTRRLTYWALLLLLAAALLWWLQGRPG